ncbi:MAG TPA: cytochrome C oxidase subunit IV family protein [Polyangiaceae bacterium]|nr:cytochrome C oxidase subunit IV family protein [Polyangiaceae bacterium]
MSSNSSTHVLPLRIYLSVFSALLVLTATTVAVAFIDMGPLNNLVAMGIAGLKASLVILYFMHVRYQTRLTALVIASGFFTLAVMVGLTLVDYATRGWLGVAGR